MLRMVALGALLVVMSPGLVVGPGAAGGEDVVVGHYLGGGSFMGTSGVCMPNVPGPMSEELSHDLLLACDLRCPGNTCNIEVVDDVWGHGIGFRICFDGEDFCRPNVYSGFANVAGSKVTVVPQTERGTRGTVYVR